MINTKNHILVHKRRTTWDEWTIKHRIIITCSECGHELVVDSVDLNFKHDLYCWVQPHTCPQEEDDEP
jgi:hypothetical protein